MLAYYEKKSRLPLWVGFLGAVVGRIMMMATAGTNQLLSILGTIIMFVCIILFIWGCSLYAKAKGQHPLLGLLGLFSIIGILVLAMLPDMFPNLLNEGKKTAKEPQDNIPPPYHPAEPTTESSKAIPRQETDV